jgi:hypothetical protein
MTKKSKTSRVLEHLQNHGTITSWESIQLFRATRISAIIHNLRKHYDITTEMLDGEDGRYGKYIYHGEIAV